MGLILATGGLGFIGSHTCINLIKRGLDVLIIDSLINSSIDNLERIKMISKKNNDSNIGKVYFYKGDLRDTNLLDEIFYKHFLKKESIEAAIHFAGLKSVEESVAYPIKYWDTNLNSLLSLMKVMAKYECKTLVFSSSATIYKSDENKKFFEDSPKLPSNPYGYTKLTIEQILRDIFISDNQWKIMNLRYFNPVGAHHSGLLGEYPGVLASNLFPIISKVLIGQLEKLFIFGNNWPTKDGTCIRDYIHVMDLAEAHFAAIKFLCENKPLIESINIGNSEGYSVLEIVRNYSKVNNLSIPFEFAARRKGDIPFVVADNKLALELLDWRPSRNIDKMCIDSFNYIKNNFDIKNL